MQRSAFRSMGTDVELVGPLHHRFETARDVVEATFRREDERFSRFRAGSELSHVNRHAGDPTEISATFARVTRLALDAAERTGGVFDPTLLDAIVAAGYDRDFDEVLAGARVALRPGRPGGRWREIRLDGSTIRLPRGVGLDFGGLAKGYAADRVAARLRALGIGRASIDLGSSSMRFLGSGWLIATSQPEQLFAVRDGDAVSTSGTSERGAHIVDPRSGSSLRGNVSATAFARNALEAEVASKSLLLNREARGAWLLNREGDLTLSSAMEQRLL